MAKLMIETALLTKHGPSWKLILGRSVMIRAMITATLRRNISEYGLVSLSRKTGHLQDS
jgi:hypothetical protein